MTIFNNVFSSTPNSLNPLLLLLALSVSLLLGFAITCVYKYRTLYTREFIIMLILLPSLMTLVIFLINGSLGTSIAVAGTFSLIRFRSATISSRELLAVFLSMIIGLATGSGYLLLAIIFTSLILGVWFLLEKGQSRIQIQKSRHLTLTLPKKEQVEEQIQARLDSYCSSFKLISIKSSKQGKELTLNYEIELLSARLDFSLSNDLIDTIENIDISLTTKANKGKKL